jgi:AcrR family transcriptional regulator
MPRAGLDAAGVVGAAAALADAEGLDRLTLARLADRLGIRPPSLYAHIGGLADLRRRLADRGARELGTALRSAAMGRARGEALVAIADAYRAYALAHPGSYAALQLAPEVRDSEAARELVEVVVAVLRGYGLDGDDAVHAVRVIRAALHGFVMLETGAGFGMPLDLDESYARLVATLDRGLVARESR